MQAAKIICALIAGGFWILILVTPVQYSQIERDKCLAKGLGYSYFNGACTENIYGRRYP